MGFREQLIEKLGENFFSESEKKLLSPGYQKIGDIIILNLNLELLKYKNEIGRAILEIFPRVRSVCVRTGEIKGEFREPSLELVAGDKNTEICHFENNCYFCFDISKIMWAKGNVAERGRLAKLVGKNEIIVDMFVGIGYFSIPIAKMAKPEKIYAIDLNPNSIKYLKKTIEKNKLKNIEVLHGDSKEEVEKLLSLGIKADRVLMGYLPPPKDFIESAMKIIKKNGFIHYDELISVDFREEDLKKTMNLFNEIGVKLGKKAVLINAQRVKSYKPRVDHYVFDIRIE
jgi:tRNA wybutosine-synthesizing protein 2